MLTLRDITLVSPQYDEESCCFPHTCFFRMRKLMLLVWPPVLLHQYISSSKRKGEDSTGCVQNVYDCTANLCSSIQRCIMKCYQYIKQAWRPLHESFWECLGFHDKWNKWLFETTLLSPESNNSNCTLFCTSMKKLLHSWKGWRESRVLKSSWVLPSGKTCMRFTFLTGKP